MRQIWDMPWGKTARSQQKVLVLELFAWSADKNQGISAAAVVSLLGNTVFLH